MHRFWLALAVCLSALTVLDLGAIVEEDFTGKSITEIIPGNVRCRLVDAVMSLPFGNNYKSNEAVVRDRNNCPR